MAITGIITDTQGHKIYPVTKAGSVYTSTGMTVEEALTFRQTPQHATYADGVFTITSSGLTSTPKPGQTLIVIFDSAASVAGTSAQLKMNSGQSFPMYMAGASQNTAFDFAASFDANVPNNALGKPFMFVFCDNGGNGAWLCVAPTRTVWNNDIANGAINTAKLTSSAVTTPIIADGAVTTAKIAQKAVTSNNIDWATTNENVPFAYVSPKVTTNNVAVRRYGGLMNWGGSFFLKGDIAYNEVLFAVNRWTMVGQFQFQNTTLAVGPENLSGGSVRLSLKWVGSSATSDTWHQLSLFFFVTPA